MLEVLREVEEGKRWVFRRKRRVEEEVRLDVGWRSGIEAIAVTLS